MPAGVASYSLVETARILRVSPRRLRYWRRTALVRASGCRGAQPAFDFRDLVFLRALVSLLRDVVSLRRIRTGVARARERLPELPLGALCVAPGSRRVAVRHGDLLLEPDGQLVLDFAAPEGRVEAMRGRRTEPSAAETESALAWFERGCALDADPATWREAVDAYRQALVLEPDFADAHCNLGTLHYNRSQRDEARACYEAALRCDPGHLEAHFNLGNLLEEDGRRERALHHYKAAGRADPFFPEAQLNLALLYEKLGLRRTAREHWRRYLQIVPEGAWSEIARERLREGGPPTA
jgi:tetratricopeptide (TPR) repeat protein